MNQLGSLGWQPPVNRDHERTYAIVNSMPEGNCPVVIGMNWYASFDRPMRDVDGAWWIGEQSNWGTVRGGHCICLRPPGLPDIVGAHAYWNQGVEGACVGFGVSRAASLFNRRLYDGFSLYRAAQQRDEWPGESYSGTSVNAGLQTLRIDGAWRATPSGTRPVYKDGCSSFMWASTVDDIVGALKTNEPFVRVLNSWGLNYPAEVRISLESLQRLMNENAEAGIPIDRAGRANKRMADGSRAN